jgi:Na+-translocating membrane potential-generating system MpsC-like protein
VHNERHSGLASRLSGAATGVLARHVNPGATKIRTVVDARTILMIFSHGLTKGELTLIGRGKADHVLATRRKFQWVLRDDLVRVVEELSRRVVTAYLADYHLDPDVGINVFLLDEPPLRQPPERNPDGTYSLDTRTRRRLAEVPPRVA